MKSPFLSLVAALATFVPTVAMAQWGGYYPQPQQLFERIDYNGVIIRSDIYPGTIICPLVEERGLPCEGYRGFDRYSRTHIFRNNGGVNRGWYGQERPHQWSNPAPVWGQPSWNRSECVFQNQHLRILCD